jgi:hypothetical protein
MSNGIDALANGNNKDLNDIVSQTPENVYVGQNFTGGNMTTPNVINIDGVAQTLDTGASIGNNVESINDLGTARNLDIQSSQKGN